MHLAVTGARPFHQYCRELPRPRSMKILQQRSAFTLVETMVTMAIFLLVLSGIVTSFMYGLRMFELAKPKLSASDDARTTISKLVDEVRSANIIRIGSGN